MEWLLLVLLLLVIAALVWMLLRRPGASEDGDEGSTRPHERQADAEAGGPSRVDTDDGGHAGGGHAGGATGGATAVPRAAAGAPYDQEAEDRDDPDRATYTDTGSGTEVPVDAGHGTHDGRWDRDSGDYEDADSAGSTYPPDSFAPGSENAPESSATEQTDAGHPGPSSQHAGSADYPTQTPTTHPGRTDENDQAAPAMTAQGTSPEQGHPGAGSQHAGEATYAPEAETAYQQHPATQGQPGPRDDTWDRDQGWRQDDTQPGHGTDHVASTDQGGDYGYDEAHGGATAAGGFSQGAYGPGSAQPTEEGGGPSGWAVKGNVGSMLFHTPDSPSYDSTRAEVWFESEEAARAAGFAHWDRKRR